MGRCNSGDRIAENHIHTDTTLYNRELSEQKNRLGTISNRLLGVGVGGL